MFLELKPGLKLQKNENAKKKWNKSISKCWRRKKNIYIYLKCRQKQKKSSNWLKKKQKTNCNKKNLNLRPFYAPANEFLIELKV